MNLERPEIDFVYFDLGNVLLDFDHPRASRQMADVSGVAEDRIWSTVFQGDLQRAYERGEIDCGQFDALFRDACRPSKAYELAELKRAASDIFRPNAVGNAFARFVAEQSVRRGILSNTCPAHWEFVLEQPFGSEFPRFDAIALSYELKSMKPEPAIYERAAKLAGTAPERILFVDDREENVAGALAAGYRAHVFHDGLDWHSLWNAYRPIARLG